jgi:hypothetical protein
MITVPTGLDYLIDHLRLHLGDVDSTSYEYSNEYLRTALVYGLKALGYRWNHRYLISASYVVSRNALCGYLFMFSPPPVVQAPDEIIIVLQASIMVKMGRNRSSAANVASWRDDEISYSNIAASRAMTDDLQQDIDWLNSLLPKKKLYSADRQGLPGFEHSYEDMPGLE